MWASRWIAAVAAIALATGCFGYNRSAKRWSYAGNVLLMLGGGGAIASGILAEDEPCTGNGCPMYTSPVDGNVVAGALLVTMGLVGIVLNATRPIVKTQSR
jgi:hypothetical protein